METTCDFGIKLRKLRKSRGESLTETAKAIPVDRAYLNKIELGSIRPSKRLLEKLLVHFSVEGNDATMLKQLAGHAPLNIAVVAAQGEPHMAQPFPVAMPQQMAQVAINPAQTPVLYTDSIIVSASEFGLVLDVAQTFGGAAMQQNVVARIGMSYDHAKKLVAKIQDQIETNER
jgi:transcriptional regulator with XRE-family HTH domain